MKMLFVIPARGGSKGIPGKNIKLLGGKPLIHYSIEYARQFVADKDICLSSDDENIIFCASAIGYEAPFIRPADLATDHSGSFEVLKHALQFYRERNIIYEVVVLLQPTSPFRLKSHLEEALTLYDAGVDMIVSVNQSSSNPYYNLFEMDKNGNLQISKGNGTYIRRQDAPVVYCYNGSIYIINSKSLLTSTRFKDFLKVKPYEMDASYSIDLDEPKDWELAENFIKTK